MTGVTGAEASRRDERGAGHQARAGRRRLRARCGRGGGVCIVPFRERDDAVRHKEEANRVFLVVHDKEPQDSGSDFAHSQFLPSRQDTQIVGVYSSLAKATRAARHYVLENFFVEEEDEDEDVCVGSLLQTDPQERAKTTTASSGCRPRPTVPDPGDDLRDVDWEGEGWYREAQESRNDDRVTIKRLRLDEPEYGSSDSDDEEGGVGSEHHMGSQGSGNRRPDPGPAALPANAGVPSSFSQNVS